MWRWFLVLKARKAAKWLRTLSMVLTVFKHIFVLPFCGKIFEILNRKLWLEQRVQFYFRLPFFKWQYCSCILSFFLKKKIFFLGKSQLNSAKNIYT